MATQYTQASNGRRFDVAGVDPSTGLYSHRIPLLTISALDNDDNSVKREFALSYNCMSSSRYADFSPYGCGWTMDGMSMLTADTLTLSNGEKFQLAGYDVDGKMQYKDRKTHDFDLIKTGTNLAQRAILYKDGVVEVLSEMTNNTFLLYKMIFPNGEKYYADTASINNLNFLSLIRDTSHNSMLVINYNGEGLTSSAEVWMGHATKYRQIVTVSEADANGSYTRLDSYTQDSNDTTYMTETVTLTQAVGVQDDVKDFVLLTNSVCGDASETINYDPDPHLCSNGGKDTFFPRVLTYTADPGGNQTPLNQKFSYPENGSNFLGYDNTYSQQDYTDCLYNFATPDAYSYWVTVTSSDGTAGASEKEITSTYNAFHLQKKEVVIEKGCAQETILTYLCDQGNNSTKTYGDQPEALLFPVIVEKKFYKVDTNNQKVGDAKSFYSRFSYDSFGNQTMATKPSEMSPDLNEAPDTVTQTYVYYDVEKDYDDCPKDPFNCFNRYMMSSTTSSPDGLIQKVKTFTYKELAIVNEGDTDLIPYTVKASTVKLGDGKKNVVAVAMTYNITPDQIYTHNQFASATFTVTDTDGKDWVKTCDFTTTYSGKDNTVTKEKTFTALDDETSFSYTKTTTIHSELVTNFTSRHGVTYAAEYDNCGKPTKITNNVGTDYEESETFVYNTTASKGPYTTLTDPTGGQQRIQFDQAGNIIEYARTARDSLQDSPPTKASTNPVFYTIFKELYDEYGRKVCRTEMDYDGDGELKYSTETTITYDGWGTVYDQISSDGVVERTVNDPRTLTQEQTTVILDSNAKIKDQLAARKTKFSPSQNPLSKIITRTDKAETTITTTFSYDGMERHTGFNSPLSQTVSLDAFDLFDRVLQVTDPLGRIANVEYAPSSPKQHVQKLALVDSSGKELSVLGEQTFDGIGRLTSRTVSGLTTTSEYTGSLVHASKITTPSGKVIEFDFNDCLTDLPDKITEYSAAASADNIQVTNEFSYGDKTTPESCSKLSSSTNSFMQLSATYTADGQRKTEDYASNDDVNGSTVFKTCTLRGKPLTQTLKTANGEIDVIFKYDDYGRIKKKTQGNIVIDMGYDKFGRLSSETVSTDDRTVGQTTTIEFDDMSRETKRTIKAGTSGDELVLTYGHDVCNKVTSRELTLNGTCKLSETFTYDKANRLLEHSIADGYDEAYLPTTSFNNKFTRQQFEYDIRDNISKVNLAMPNDDTTNVATYKYIDGTCRLSTITNTSSKFPTTISFTFDGDGNVSAVDTDGKKLSMTYSTAGRLLSYDDNGKKTTFKYDSLQRVVRDNSRTRLMSNGLVFAESDNSDGSAKVTEFVRSGTHVVVEKSTSETRFVGSDRQISAVSSHTGEKMDITSYSAYGSGETPKTRSGYAGELRTASLYALGNGTRFYLAELQMFCSADGFTPFSQGGINPYTYCRGDGMNNLDPTGHAGFSTGWDLGLNCFAALVDLIAVGIAIFTVVATGGAGTAIVGLCTSMLGVTSDVLGIASDSMAIADSKSGVSRSSTEQNLGIASAVFGGLSMLTGSLDILPPVQKREGKKTTDHYWEKYEKANKKKSKASEQKKSSKDNQSMWGENDEKKLKKHTEKSNKYADKINRYCCDELQQLNPKLDGKAGWALSNVTGADFDSYKKLRGCHSSVQRRVKYSIWAFAEISNQAVGYALLSNFGISTYASNHPQPGAPDSSSTNPSVDDGLTELVTDSVTNGYPNMEH